MIQFKRKIYEEENMLGFPDLKQGMLFAVAKSAYLVSKKTSSDFWDVVGDFVWNINSAFQT